ARWNGSTSTWNHVSSDTAVTGTTVSALGGYKGSLVVGGLFTSAGGVANTVDLATWSGECFYTIGTEEGTPSSPAPSLARLKTEPERLRSVLLTRLGRSKASVTAAPWYGPRQASPATPTEEQLAVQWRLAASVALKLGVQAEGWYKVSQFELVAAGLDPRVNPRYLQLFADGVEVPLLVTGEQDGRFDASDAIEFYGLGLDT